jgi:DNA polymerase-3 subunit epsilon
MTYTIIDVETTGRTNRMTEISIFKYDGQEVIDEFTTLINPEMSIPRYITALTGIDDQMVEDAPVFEEVAQQILELTEDAVFVAHNVNFDYNIIRNEFKNIGITFNRKKLCTVRLSRKLLPGHRSYGLGNLCRDLEIPIIDRHRAKGDAEATVILFEMLLKKDQNRTVIDTFLNPRSKQATLPSHLPTSVFDNLPHQAGIYYFKDKHGKIIYIGKAKDIRKRVLSHFYSKSKKSLSMCRETRDIDFELSGSELLALLMEDFAIKKHYPFYNKQSKKFYKRYGIFSYQDMNGVMHLAYNTLSKTLRPLMTFQSIRDCRSFLELTCLKFELCPKYCHLQEQVEECNHFSIKTCKGICRNAESVDAYNQRVKQFIDQITDVDENHVIEKEGRHTDESAFILIQNGEYKGYGFVDKHIQISNVESLEHHLIPQQHNVDTERILRPYLMPSFELT